MNIEKQIELATKAREAAYCPYSGFAVGVCLVGKSGKIYTGCNIENSSFSPTICAERVAIFKAVSEGEKEFESIVIVGGNKKEKEFSYCPPCGVCRQVMSEFCKDDFNIILADSEKNYKYYRLGQLYPHAFIEFQKK